MAVPPNYMSVLNPDFYVPKSVQGGFGDMGADEGISRLPNGEIDPISLLYSDANLP